MYVIVNIEECTSADTYAKILTKPQQLKSYIVWIPFLLGNFIT